MKKIVGLFFAVTLSFSLLSQTTISGNITDANTGEALIGATVIFGKGQGTATDFDGNYSFKIHDGERSLKVSYVGYKEISKIIAVAKTPQTLNFKLKTVLLNEVTSASFKLSAAQLIILLYDSAPPTSCFKVLEV